MAARLLFAAKKAITAGDIEALEFLLETITVEEPIPERHISILLGEARRAANIPAVVACLKVCVIDTHGSRVARGGGSDHIAAEVSQLLSADPERKDASTAFIQAIAADGLVDAPVTSNGNSCADVAVSCGRQVFDMFFETIPTGTVDVSLLLKRVIGTINIYDALSRTAAMRAVIQLCGMSASVLKRHVTCHPPLNCDHCDCGESSLEASYRIGFRDLSYLVLFRALYEDRCETVRLMAGLPVATMDPWLSKLGLRNDDSIIERFIKPTETDLCQVVFAAADIPPPPGWVHMARSQFERASEPPQNQQVMVSIRPVLAMVEDYHRPWSMASHACFKKCVRDAVFAALLCFKRLKPRLPAEIVLIIFEHLTNYDFVHIADTALDHTQ